MTVPLPPHAYVPGRTARHPQGYWDDLRATVTASMTTGQIAASAALAAGMTFFKAGFFWEAHEMWEAVWMACPPNSAERRLLRALIQLTNAELKLAMDRPRAARRLCAIAGRHLDEATPTGQCQVLGIDAGWVGTRIDACRKRASGMLASVL